MTPVDLNLLIVAYDDYFTLDVKEQTITLSNSDENLPRPHFYVVLCNIIGDIVLWQQFKIELRTLPQSFFTNSAPSFEPSLPTTFTVE